MGGEIVSQANLFTGVITLPGTRGGPALRDLEDLESSESSWRSRPLLQKAPSGFNGEPFLPTPACHAIPARQEVPWHQPSIPLRRKSDITHCRVTGNGSPLDHRTGL